MALLGTFLNTGVFSLGNGVNCLAHSLPTTPDFATYFPITATLTVPNLNSRNATSVNYNNQGSAINGEAAAFAFHSIIR